MEGHLCCYPYTLASSLAFRFHKFCCFQGRKWECKHPCSSSSSFLLNPIVSWLPLWLSQSSPYPQKSWVVLPSPFSKIPLFQTVFTLFFLFLWSLSFSFLATHCPHPFYLWDFQLWLVSTFLTRASASFWVLTSWKQSLILPYPSTCCIWKLVVTQLPMAEGTSGELPTLRAAATASQILTLLLSCQVKGWAFFLFWGELWGYFEFASIAIHWLFLNCSDPKGKEIKYNCVDLGFAAFILQKAF